MPMAVVSQTDHVTDADIRIQHGIDVFARGQHLQLALPFHFAEYRRGTVRCRSVRWKSEISHLTDPRVSQRLVAVQRLYPGT